MADAHELEKLLDQANERFARATEVMAPKHPGDGWDLRQGGMLAEYHAALDEVKHFERKLAAARGEEYLEPLDFPVKWCAGAPMPQLFVNDYRALLAFRLHERDPNWDGSYITLKSASSEQPERVAVVEFERCHSAKLGGPNDEVFEGHPLSRKGLVAYSAQQVVNSRWIKELEGINSVHHMYRPESWRDLHHYVFWFHDSTFECVARSFSVQVYRESMKSVLARMLERLVSTS
jgi:hypothetical protein